MTLKLLTFLSEIVSAKTLTELNAEPLKIAATKMIKE